MKNRLKKFGAALMAGALCLTVLTSCSSGNHPSPSESSSVASDQNAPEKTTQAFQEYDFPEMGMTASLPASLLERVERDELSMLTYTIPTEDGSALQYGCVSWMVAGAENGGMAADQSTSVELGNNPATVGALGVYSTDMVDLLDEVTDCDEHLELGQSADGAYQYYLSINTAADQELTAELRQIQMTITEMASSQQSAESDAPDGTSASASVGEFTTQGVDGNTYTQEIFQDYDLTMVNVFTTWCSPCVEEMPDLEKLHQQMAEQGVNVVGVVLDVVNEKGEAAQEDLERAQLLVERTGVTYPILLPDSTYFNGRLTGIEAFPETFFVDKDGNIVGETYSGSGSLEYWQEVVQKELSNVKEGA